MANRWFTQFALTLEKQVVNLYAHVTFGSSGAPTLDAKNSKGVKSIVRNSAGDYTVTLSDGYYKLLGVNHVFDASGNSGTAPASPLMYVKSKSIAQTAATVEVVFTVAAGTATDPASGEGVYLNFILGNSTAF